MTVPAQSHGTTQANYVPPDLIDDNTVPHEDALWECPAPDGTQTPLQVELAQSENPNFTDDALVFKIRPQEKQPTHDSSGLMTPPQKKFGIEKAETDSAKGFAINIPVQKDTIEADPFDNDGPSSWEFSSRYSVSDRSNDEEDPLIQDDSNFAMSFKGGHIPSERSAFVQRKGARNIAEEQEVLYAVPNGESFGTRTTGLLLPVMDSRDDLRQLMLVVPPEQANPLDENDTLLTETDVPSTKAEATREYVESITHQIPPIVDVDSTLAVHGTAEKATVEMSVTKQVSWLGYAVLAVALASVASQGTAVKWQPNVDGLIAATWLMQTQTLIMFPFAVYQYFTMNVAEHEELLKPQTHRRILAASLSQVCWAAGFFVAVDHTSLFHAWSLNNVHPLIIVLVGLVTKVVMPSRNVRVNPGEILGAEVALVGVFLMVIPTALRGDMETITGDLVAMAGSLGAIAFLQICKSLRSQIPLFLMMTPIAGLNAVFLSMGSMIVNGTDFSMTDHGALGWLRGDRIWLGLYLGGVVGFLGTVSCIAALKYLPKVVVGSVQTMMPVAGTLVAIAAGLDTFPDFWTTIGGAAMLYGVFSIADATRQSEVTVVINPHIQEVGGPNFEINP